jgi:hypothetical protein
LNLTDPLGTCDNPQGCDGSNTAGALAQGTINLVPGAHYAGLAQQQFNAGNYGAAVVYGTASLADAALGMATFGMSTRSALD